MSGDVKTLGAFVWSIAELLRGDFKQSEYGKVILPFVVLRRLDCILEESKPAVLQMAESLPDEMDDEARDTLLSGAVGRGIKLYNLSRFTFASLRGQDAKDIHKNLLDYITKFSGNVRDIFLEKFLFTDQLKRLNDAGCSIRSSTVHPDRPPSGCHLQSRDGLPVRGADPPVLGNLQ
jgi:type I restriction enzyme M protein